MRRRLHVGTGLGQDRRAVQTEATRRMCATSRGLSAVSWQPIPRR
ncbi:hypothetical protein [Herbidospora cretacea]|nr:hypothetical protein [Herbidospora cretacea]